VKVLIIGDSHRNVGFFEQAFDAAAANGCARIVQLGDFGFGWRWLDLGDSLAICRFSAEVALLVERFGIPVDFVDGNHENFDRLLSMPLRDDGTHEVAPGVRHLPRGYRYELDGCSFLALGGAVSLDKIARTALVSWWPDEAITDADVAACGTGKVDVLLCHDMPLQSEIHGRIRMSGYGIPADVDAYLSRMKLSDVVDATEPDWIFHGHIHHRYQQDPGATSGATIVGLAHDRQALAKSSVVFDTRTRMIVPADERRDAVSPAASDAPGHEVPS